jgi:LPXTG-site transpeptidase (sortase) family protein
MRSAGLILFLSLVGIILVVSAGRFITGASAPSELAAPVADSGMIWTDLPAEPKEGAEVLKTRALSFHVREVRSSAVPTQVSPGPEPAEAKEALSFEVFGKIKRLDIPSIKLTAKVIYLPFEDFTWDVSTLGQDIARLEGIQGDGNSNLVLAGHVTLRDGRNGPFHSLAALKPGESVLVHAEDKIYTFRVRESLVVYPEAVNVTADSILPQLTLITCTSWDQETLSYLRRQVVIADLEKVEFIHTVEENN